MSCLGEGGVLTVVPSSEGPHGASVLGQSDGVGAATRHLPHVADVFDQGGDVAAVAVAVA